LQHKNILRKLSDFIKHSNVNIIGVPEEKETKRPRNFIEEIIAGNSPNLGKEKYIQSQEAQRTSIKEYVHQEILFKLAKYTDKEKF